MTPQQRLAKWDPESAALWAPFAAALKPFGWSANYGVLVSKAEGVRRRWAAFQAKEAGKAEKAAAKKAAKPSEPDSSDEEE